MLWPVVVLLYIFAFFVKMPWIEEVITILAIAIGISFRILPGLIYGDGYKNSWLNYAIFWGLTFCFGPIYIFFKIYDPILKESYKDNKYAS